MFLTMMICKFYYIVNNCLEKRSRCDVLKLVQNSALSDSANIHQQSDEMADWKITSYHFKQ